jgi:hypothetical protein
VYDGWVIDEVLVDDGGTLFYDGFEGDLSQWDVMDWAKTIDIPQAYVADSFDTVNTPYPYQGEWLVWTPLSGAGTHFEGEFDDYLSYDPLYGLPVLCHVEFDSFLTVGDEDYVLIYYEITNTGAEDHEDLYVGQWSNWDMNWTYTDDTYEYHTGLDCWYSYDYNSDIVGGLKYVGWGFDDKMMIPGDTTSVNFVYGGTHTDWEMFDNMANGEHDAFQSETYPTETYAHIGTGPWDIPVGGTLKLCFAVVFGDNLADWEDNVEAACAKCAEMHNESLITFDEYPDTLAPIPKGTNVGLLWADWGVQISAISGNTHALGAFTGDITVPECDDCTPVSDPNFLMTNNNNSDAGEITFTFVSPYDNVTPLTCSEVSLWFLDLDEINITGPVDGTSRL